MHHDALGAVLGLAHGDQVAPAEPAGLDGLEAVAAPHDDAVHPRPGRRQPAAVDLDVGRQVGGREEAFGQHAVGRQRREARRRARRRTAARQNRAMCWGCGACAGEARGETRGIQAPRDGSRKRLASAHTRGDFMRRSVRPARHRRRSPRRRSAQEPVRTDTSGRDTTRVTQLPEVQVTVTRTAEPLVARALRGRGPRPRRPSSAGSRRWASTRR